MNYAYAETLLAWAASYNNKTRRLVARLHEITMASTMLYGHSLATMPYSNNPAVIELIDEADSIMTGLSLAHQIMKLSGRA